MRGTIVSFGVFFFFLLWTLLKESMYIAYFTPSWWSLADICQLLEREREIYFKSHISLWEHSSHFRLIGRGVPSVSVVSQLMYKFLCLASPEEIPQVPM